MQQDKIAGQLQEQIERTDQADEVCKAGNLDLMLLMGGARVGTLSVLSSQPDDDLLVKIGSIKVLVTRRIS